jgi:hypothetical protein
LSEGVTKQLSARGRLLVPRLGTSAKRAKETVDSTDIVEKLAIEQLRKSRSGAHGVV